MHRALIRMFVALALAAGLSFAVVGTTAGNASAAQPAARAAGSCTTEQSNYNAALAHKHAVKHKLKKAKHALKQAKRHHNKAKVRHLRKKVHRLYHRLQSAETKAEKARAALNTCKAGGGTSSPIQTLCDSGVPQPVCDALAGLAGGGLPSDVSLDTLCTQVPQAQPLCDAAAGSGLPTDPSALTGLLGQIPGLPGGGLPSDFTSIQTLCDSGVPQAVCDGLAGAAGGGLPSDLSLQQLCDAVSQAQPLCDAANGGTLPTDPSALTDLLGPILDLLGLGDILGGGLPLPAPSGRHAAAA
ncbi:hypothetical protein [Nocardioides panacisoli]|uniref:Secreted protein n=1 Tax=Nocardioides panacisoli TaxID=627624 RepID=A0ABP7IRJ0_9ACTN